MPGTTVISTWFVADDAGTATYFPQVSASSDAPEAQAVYWRCIVCFFASSLKINPTARHVFFTNTNLPCIDGVDVCKLFASWGVSVVKLPITYRLPKGSVGSWGNQFYVFDVIQYAASDPTIGRLILLDSDMLWLKPMDSIVEAVDKYGALTYELGDDEYLPDAPINGRTRQELARFLAQHGGPDLHTIPYHGGEFYAATAEVNRRVIERAKLWWGDVAARQADAPLEEAHFLSTIFAMEGIAPGTANQFVRRMWTTFSHNNLRASDRDLALWHLPAEKKTGFAELFAELAALPEENYSDPGNLEFFNTRNYALKMGWPRRRPAKFIKDLYLKLREKAAR